MKLLGPSHNTPLDAESLDPGAAARYRQFVKAFPRAELTLGNAQAKEFILVPSLAQKLPEGYQLKLFVSDDGVIDVTRSPFDVHFTPQWKNSDEPMDKEHIAMVLRSLIQPSVQHVMKNRLMTLGYYFNTALEQHQANHRAAYTYHLRCLCALMEIPGPHGVYQRFTEAIPELFTQQVRDSRLTL